jgi:hypothetical protein
LQRIDEEGFGGQARKEEQLQHLLRANQNLRNLQGKNNATLLRSIEVLKSNERHYLPNIEAEPQLESIRKDDSLLLLETIEPIELAEVIEEGS